MWTNFIALGLSLALSTPALAQNCDALREQLSSRTGLDTYLQQETAKDVICAIALQSNGKTSSYCYAIFAYRDSSAKDAFTKLGATLSNCFNPIMEEGTGDIVNHPDSFDQKQFCFPSNDLSLSLKDKAALNQTLVFLRLDNSDPNASLCE